MRATSSVKKSGYPQESYAVRVVASAEELAELTVALAVVSKFKSEALRMTGWKDAPQVVTRYAVKAGFVTVTVQQ